MSGPGDASQLPAVSEPRPGDWRSWAPPLDPPGPGLPESQAAAIADLWWELDPHECAAQQWEAYAATLPITNAVSQVATGSQSVTYSPPRPGGTYGEALARAEWHRSFSGSGASVPLAVEGAPPGYGWARL